ncbi:MAG: hypothetical protein CME36_09395 [unclassified Hahellaceae]|nr:hypothetical protein [Hahellaceae bacterium]|tara:strand:- start:8836 stop:9234 length:399 start_codon:yes stop_codon:yes gene_type:complete
MGAWSHEPFGNDDAGDWSSTLVDENDLTPIEAVFDRALASDDYLEADTAGEAVAAVEVVAKLLGKGTQTDAYTAEVDKWVEATSVRPDAALRAKALQVLDRVVQDDSELKELWEDHPQWLESISELRRAVKA